MQWKKWTRRLCGGLLFGAVMTVSAVAASGVITDTAQIAGRSAQFVYMQMGENRTVEISLAKDSVFRAVPSDELIDQMRSQGNVVAAINGAYFTEMGGGNARLYATVMKDGVLQNGGDTENMFGITWDGKPYINRVTYKTRILFDNAYAELYGVNVDSNDTKAIILLTSAYTKEIKVPTGGKIYTLRDGKVVAESGAGSYDTPAASTQLLVYNAGAVAEKQKYQLLPQVENSFKISTRATDCLYSSNTDLTAWNNMKTVSGGGRILLKDGNNVTRDDDCNGKITEAAQNADYVSKRAFIAIAQDGRLVFGAATASMHQIAESLRTRGMVDAIALDGGASTTLYTPQSGFLLSAGRNLASAIVVVDKKSMSPKPDGPSDPEDGPSDPEDVPSDPELDPNEPSDWAKPIVKEGIRIGLIPDWLQYQYRQNITRREFCVLILTLLESKSGMSIDAYREAQGVEYSCGFKDTDDWYVRECASLGLVEGTGASQFFPEASLTREQAATILQRVAQRLNASPIAEPKQFADEDQISDWAKEAIDYVTSVGVMQGTGDNFNPQSALSREQAYITMVNAYKKIS